MPLAIRKRSTKGRMIEARVGMEKSKVSRAAARLEDQGFIEKRVNETDRRLVQLTLTQKGRSLMAELLPLAAAFQADVERREAVDLIEKQVVERVDVRWPLQVVDRAHDRSASDPPPQEQERSQSAASGEPAPVMPAHEQFWPMQVNDVVLC